MEFVSKPKKMKVYGSSADASEDSFARPQDPLVASVMEEDQARKKAKKGDTPAGWKKKKDGLTLEQVEELEGGTIRESKAGMAATDRADRRKRQGDPDETGMLRVDDLKRAEERLNQSEEDGMTLEPFNLVQEREEGSFDEAGNYVEKKRDDEDDPQDAWLASDEAKVLSDEMRQKVEAQNARMASAEEAPTITPRETADLMRELVEILQPRETVTRALKRLRPVKPKSKRKDSSAPKAEKSAEEKAIEATFEKLTEVSSTLLDAGETDVYTMSREDFEAKASKYPAVEDDFDMFGDATGLGNGVSATRAPILQEARDAPAGPHSATQPEFTQQARNSQNGQESKAVANVVDYNSWPVKELARFLKERGEDPSGIIEKADLVKKVEEVAAKGPEGEQPQVPLGYVWDPKSKYYYNPETAMYYDAKSGAYFSASDGQWYSYDTTAQKFVKAI